MRIRIVLKSSDSIDKMYLCDAIEFSADGIWLTVLRAKQPIAQWRVVEIIGWECIGA